MEPPSTFDRAIRRKARKRAVAKLRRQDTSPGLLPLDEVSRRLRMFEQTYVGIRTIPVAKIVGTVDRSHDFDRDFLPRRREIGARWRSVERRFAEGDFPPIEVYEIDGRYFLVDGHHRVAIARQRGVEHIDAEVTRLRTRYPLPSEADIARIVHTEQEMLFLDESGLGRARPEARIAFSRPNGYVELLEQVKVHGYHLMQERGEVVPREEVAGDWYDRVYLPGVGSIRAEGLSDLFPEATEGDLFLWVQQRRRLMYPERGDTPFHEAAHILAISEAAHHPTRRARKRLTGLRARSRAREDHPTS